MFTVDLLKGEGLPAKGRSRDVVLAALTTVLPTIVAIAMFGVYLSNKIVTSIDRREVTRYKTKTQELSDAVAQHRAYKVQSGAYDACLSEVAFALGQHTQWSEVLATVVQNMPESVVLRVLEVEQRNVKRQIPKRDDPKKMVDVTVAVPTLRMTVSASPRSDSDEAIQNFRNRLLSSAILKPRLENIVVSQTVDKLNELEVVSYGIDCLFKPKL
jgi:hypothetical protein